MTPPPQALQTALREVAEILGKGSAEKNPKIISTAPAKVAEMLWKFCGNSPNCAETFSAKTRAANALPDARSSPRTLPPDTTSENGS